MSFIRFIDSYKTVIIFLIILYFFVGSIFAAIIQDHQAAVPADPLHYRIPLLDHSPDIFFFIICRHNDI